MRERERERETEGGVNESRREPCLSTFKYARVCVAFTCNMYTVRRNRLETNIKRTPMCVCV